MHIGRYLTKKYKGLAKRQRCYHHIKVLSKKKVSQKKKKVLPKSIGLMKKRQRFLLKGKSLLMKMYIFFQEVEVLPKGKGLFKET